MWKRIILVAVFGISAALLPGCAQSSEKGGEAAACGCKGEKACACGAKTVDACKCK